MMSQTLREDIREYHALLKAGSIQKAYRGIMGFMANLKVYLEKKYPTYLTSALYLGYMDMTYFAFTPESLKNKKLKIAVVFLHEECRFDVWLGATNRRIQSDFIDKLRNQDLGAYQLSAVGPGVDSIIESILVDEPDFDRLDELKTRIEDKLLPFIEDVAALLED